MELVNHVSAFQNYQNLFDVTAEGTKEASENSEPTKKQVNGTR